GKYYVSILTTRNIFCIDDPIVPVAAMIHTHKLTSDHAHFLFHIFNEITVPKNSCITIDREKAISNAISLKLPSLKFVFCTIHILRNIKTFLNKFQNTTQDDYSVY